MKKYKHIFFIAFILFGVLYPASSSVVFAQFGGANPLQIFSAAFGAATSPLTWISNHILSFSGWLMGFAGIMFNAAISELVINMSSNISSLGVVDTGWRTFRDFANIIFIFVLIYASIATVLNVRNFNTKRAILMVVIIGLLINFSLFFTKVIIDASNIVSLQFYNAIEIIDEKTGEVVQRDDNSDGGGIAGVFANAMKIQSIYDTKTGNNISRAKGLTSGQIVIVGMFGSVFLLITGFIFFAGAILLVSRFVILVLLMILSPLAFVAMILPNTKKHWEKWKNTLLEQAFFAPVYFAMIWLTTEIVTSDEFQTTFLQNQSFGSTIYDPANNKLGIILGFGIISGFMISALVVAKMMGASGAQTTIGWGKSLNKWGQTKLSNATVGNVGRAGRAVGGRAGGYLEKKYGSDLEKATEEGGLATRLSARMGLKAINRAQTASFDVRNTDVVKAVAKPLANAGVHIGAGQGKGGFKQSIKDRAKKEEEFFKNTASKGNATVVVGGVDTSATDALKQYEKMDPNEDIIYDGVKMKASEAAEKAREQKQSEEARPEIEQAYERLTQATANKDRIESEARSGETETVLNGISTPIPNALKRIEAEIEKETLEIRKNLLIAQKAEKEYKKALAATNTFLDESANISNDAELNFEGVIKTKAEIRNILQKREEEADKIREQINDDIRGLKKQKEHLDSHTEKNIRTGQAEMTIKEARAKRLRSPWWLSVRASKHPIRDFESKEQNTNTVLGALSQNVFVGESINKNIDKKAKLRKARREKSKLTAQVSQLRKNKASDEEIDPILDKISDLEDDIKRIQNDSKPQSGDDTKKSEK